jgi:hypothetical protein
MENPHASPCAEVFYQLFPDLPTRFTERSLWGPQSTVVCLLALLNPGVTRSYRTTLPLMQQLYGKSWGWDRVPDPRSLTDARHRLGASPVEDLARRARDQALALTRAADIGPQGRRLVAFDGTDLVLPDAPGMRSRFGGPSNQHGESAGVPHALMVSAWDVVTRVPLGWTLEPYGSDERLGALKLLPQLGERDIAIFDRGYPSYAFLQTLVLEQRDFVIRMIASEVNSWPAVHEFLRSGKLEQIVEIDLGAHPQKPGERVVVKIRLIRKAFRRGRPKAHQHPETTVIATSLIDTEAYPRDELLAIYANRWGIETIHKELKVLCAMENWHTSDPELLRQEIAIIMIWQTMAAIVQHQAQQHIAQQQDNPWNHPKRKLALRTATFVAVAELLQIANQGRSCTTWQKHLRRQIRLLVTYAQKRRPGRSRARVRKRPFGRFRPTKRAA